MIRHTKAMLCAAIALCAASPADAATYVTYTIGGTATSVFSTAPAWFIAEFIVPLADIQSDGAYYGRINESRIGIGGTLIDTFGGNLRFSQQGYVRAPSILSFNACLKSPVSTIPVSSMRIAVDESCSTADILINGLPGYVFTKAIGRVDSLVVSTSDIAPFSFGLSTFVMAVPEPSTWGLMLAGLGMVAYALRKRRYSVAFD